MTTASFSLGIVALLATIPAIAYFGFGCWKLFRLITSGQPVERGTRTDQPVRRLGRLLIEVFGHSRMLKRPFFAVAHWLVMVGFLFGTVVYFEAYIQVFWPDRGWPLLGKWPIYHFVEEILGLGTVLGIAVFIVWRTLNRSNQRSSRLFNSNNHAARAIETIVFLEGLGMLLVKAAKISAFGADSYWPNFLSYWLSAFIPHNALWVSLFALLKILSGVAFFFLLGRYLNWGIAWHRFTAFFNIYFQRLPSAEGVPGGLGALKPMVSDGRAVTMDNVEDDDTTGVGNLRDGSWKMLLDATSCTECGRCQDLCPAWNTDKPLSPKKLMMDVRDRAVDKHDLLTDPSAFETPSDHSGIDVLKMAGEGGFIEDDVLWSCTNCGACVDQCPVDIEHIDHITDMRRFLVLSESSFPSELGGMFNNIEVKGNPWGRNNSERADWITDARRDGIDIPVFGEDIDNFDDTEYLLWVGCAGAFDDAGKRTSRAIAELLHTAGVKFAVLSKGESCTGDPARRAGNEFLFQMQAAKNIDTLNSVFEGIEDSRRKIIASCAHCFNSIRREYPDFDGHYTVMHHTQLLNRLVRDGRLTPVPRTAEDRRPVTYHDPCFLGRHNKVYDPPRELLESTGMELREMEYTRGEAFCCGAGGARMFMEEKIGVRVADFRTNQALATGAEDIAVGCPFCNSMFSGSTKSKESSTNVRDVAVLLRDRMLVDGSLPQPQPRKYVEHPTVFDLNPASEKTNSDEPVSTATSDDAEDTTIKPQSEELGNAISSPSVPPSAPAAPPAAPPASGIPAPPAPGGPSAGTVPPAPGAVPSVPATPPAPSAPIASPAPTPPPAAPAAPPAPSVGTTTPPVAPPAPGTPAAPPAPGPTTNSVPPVPTPSTAPQVPTPPAAPAGGSTPPPPAPASGKTPAPPTAPPGPPAPPSATSKTDVPEAPPAPPTASPQPTPTDRHVPPPPPPRPPGTA